MSDAHVYITGKHRFAKSLLAIKAVRRHTGWGLAPAKQVIDQASEGEQVALPVPSDRRESLMAALSELGWSTKSGELEVPGKAPEPPDWWRRVKGYVRVVDHLPADGRTLRMRVALRDCRVHPGDSVGWVMHENLVLALPVAVDPASSAHALVEERFATEDDLESSRGFFPVGADLEVFAPHPYAGRDSWRLASEALWAAVRCLPSEVVRNPEGGSLPSYREFMDHNELGLAFEEIVGLAEVNPTEPGFHSALARARHQLGL